MITRVLSVILLWIFATPQQRAPTSFPSVTRLESPPSTAPQPKPGPTDTRALNRSGGITHVPCGVEAKGFCMEVNGYHWQQLDHTERLTFISHYSSAVRWVIRALRPSADEDDVRRLNAAFEPMVSSLDEELAAVNGFYRTPENLGVPIFRALETAAAQQSGAPPAVVYEMAEKFRREANTYTR